MDKNNEIKITLAELQTKLGSLQKNVMSRKDRSGLTLVEYEDEYDGKIETYRILLTETNRWFNVFGTLDNAVSYQLKNLFFHRKTTIGTIIMIIAGIEYKGINFTIDEINKYFGIDL